MANKNAFNTVTTFSKITALVLFVMLPVVAFYLGILYQERIDRPYVNKVYEFVAPTPNLKDEGYACPMDAKMCPDGVTYVGRTGPNCEFKKCPGE